MYTSSIILRIYYTYIIVCSDRTMYLMNGLILDRVSFGTFRCKYLEVIVNPLHDIYRPRMGISDV